MVNHNGQRTTTAQWASDEIRGILGIFKGNKLKKIIYSASSFEYVRVSPFRKIGSLPIQHNLIEFSNETFIQITLFFLQYLFIRTYLNLKRCHADQRLGVLSRQFLQNCIFTLNCSF